MTDETCYKWGKKQTKNKYMWKYDSREIKWNWKVFLHLEKNIEKQLPQASNGEDKYGLTEQCNSNDHSVCLHISWHF